MLIYNNFMHECTIVVLFYLINVNYAVNRHINTRVITCFKNYTIFYKIYTSMKLLVYVKYI